MSIFHRFIKEQNNVGRIAKKTTALFLAAVTSFAAMSCNSEPIVIDNTEKVEISFAWWGNDSRNEYTLEAIKEFEALHPEIKVKCIYSEWTGYPKKYDIQMVSNTEADVMQINYAWLSKYSADGMGYYNLTDVDDYLNLDTFTEEDLLSGCKKGVLNAVPIASNTMTLYYNKDIYDRYDLPLPTTFDDLFVAAERMSPDEIYPLSGNKKPLWFLTVAYVESVTGKKIFDENGKFVFDKNDCKMMLEFYSKLIDQKVVPQHEYYDKKELAKGSYAGTIAWVSDAKSYCEAAEEAGYEMVVGDYPCLSSEQKISWYIKPATMYAISDSTRHPKEAAILMDYLLNSNEMAEYQGIEKGIPLSSAARLYNEQNGKLQGLQYNAHQKMEQRKADLSLISPYFEEDAYLNVFFDYCNNVIFEKASIDQAAEELYKEFLAIETQ